VAGRHFVEFDDSLNSTMNRLRGVLGTPPEAQIHRNAARLGYRFIAQVEAARAAQPTLACCLSRTWIMIGTGILRGWRG